MRNIDGFTNPTPVAPGLLDINKLKCVGDLCIGDIKGDLVTLELYVGSYDRGIYLGEVGSPTLRNVVPEVVVDDGSYVLVFPVQGRV